MDRPEGRPTIKVKIIGTPSAAAAESLGLHAMSLYSNPGKRVVGVFELKHSGRWQPGPDEDKEASVDVQLALLEVASPDQEDALRNVMRALHLARTAQGTLDDEGAVELSERTLEQAADRLLDIELSKLVVACRHWADYARRVIDIRKLSLAEARHELEIIAAGLYAATGISPSQ